MDDAYKASDRQMLEMKHKVRRALEETEQKAEDLNSAMHGPSKLNDPEEVAQLADETASAAREYYDTARDKQRMELEKMAESDPRYRLQQSPDIAWQP